MKTILKRTIVLLSAISISLGGLSSLSVPVMAKSSMRTYTVYTGEKDADLESLCSLSGETAKSSNPSIASTGGSAGLPTINPKKPGTVTITYTGTIEKPGKNYHKKGTEKVRINVKDISDALSTSTKLIKASKSNDIYLVSIKNSSDALFHWVSLSMSARLASGQEAETTGYDSAESSLSSIPVMPHETVCRRVTIYHPEDDNVNPSSIKLSYTSIYRPTLLPVRKAASDTYSTSSFVYDKDGKYTVDLLVETQKSDLVGDYDFNVKIYNSKNEVIYGDSVCTEGNSQVIYDYGSDSDPVLKPAKYTITGGGYYRDYSVMNGSFIERRPSGPSSNMTMSYTVYMQEKNWHIDNSRGIPSRISSTNKKVVDCYITPDKYKNPVIVFKSPGKATVKVTYKNKKVYKYKFTVKDVNKENPIRFSLSESAENRKYPDRTDKNYLINLKNTSKHSFTDFGVYAYMYDRKGTLKDICIYTNLVGVCSGASFTDSFMHSEDEYDISKTKFRIYRFTQADITKGAGKVVSPKKYSIKAKLTHQSYGDEVNLKFKSSTTNDVMIYYTVMAKDASGNIIGASSGMRALNKSEGEVTQNISGTNFNTIANKISSVSVNAVGITRFSTEEY